MHVQVDLRVRLGDLLQEVHELDVGVLLVELARAQLPGEDIQRGKQRGSAVAPVIMSLLQRMLRSQRLHRLRAREGLDLGLLTNAHHHRVLRWGQVQAHHVAQFRFQLRVGGEL